MTLAKKIPLSLFLFGLSMMLATYVMLVKSDNLLKSQTLRGLEREVQMLTSLIEQNLLERYHNASLFPLVLGEMESDELTYTVTDPVFLDSLNQLVKNYKVYRRIAIMDLDGQIIASNSRNHLGKTIFSVNVPRQEIIETKWFKALSNSHSAEDDVFFFGPNTRIIDTAENQYDLLIGSRLYSKDGLLIGFWLNILDFAIVEENFKYVYQLLADKGLPKVELTLLDSKGNVIIDYDPITQMSAVYKRDFSILGKLNLAEEGVEGARLAVVGLTGSVTSIHARKKIEQFTVYTHFGDYDALPDLGWSTLIRIKEDEAYKESLELREWNFYILLFSFLVIMSVTLIASKVFIQPLKRVADVIHDFSQGNLEPEIEKNRRNDEVGAINNALFRLKDKLKDREKLLKENQEQQLLVDLQRNAIDSMASGIMIADVTKPELPIIFVNRAFEFLTGYRAEETINRRFRFLWGDETDSLSTQIVEDAIAKGEACTVVITNYRKDGTPFISNLLVDPVFNDKRELTHYIGVQNDITEIKRDDEIARFALEKKIADRTKESRDVAKRLRTVFNTSLDGAVVMDESGVIVDVNHSLEVIFGRTKEEMVGKNVSILMTSDHASNHDQYIESYFSGGVRKFIGELRTVLAQHKSGRVIAIEISIGETRLENETIFVGAIRDITEQQEIKKEQLQLQQKLEEREVIYRTAFGQAAVGIARVGLTGEMLEVNQKMCTDFGYSEPELLALTVTDITFPDDLKMSLTYISELIEGKYSEFTHDKRYVRKDGSMFWANLSISLVRTDSGKPKYFISIIEDITQRKAFEQELRDSRDQREELIGGIKLASQAGGICSWSYNLITDELKWDPSTYDLYGVEQGKILTYADWRERVFTEDIDEYEEQVKLAIENRDFFESEFRFRKKGEKECRWAKVSQAITCDDDDKPIKMFGINIDITDQKKITSDLEKETKAAQHANNAKSSFLATMSHEIRTPMNGVIGMIDLFRQTPLNADQKRMATTIRDSSFALLDIINDILDFSKIEAGQVELEWTPCSVLSLMEKTADSMWVTAADKNVELILHPDLSIPKRIPLDPVRIRQILLNLVGNAVKFSQKDGLKGVVTVVSQYHAESSKVTVKVLDNGIGISKEQQENLFIPFTQADSSTTRKFGGTGLGLSITKSFVELMGGDIGVESELGKGSCFYITLPLKAFDDKSTEFAEYNFDKHRIYLCLDSVPFRDCCIQLLNQLGCSDIQVIEKENRNNIENNEGNHTILICDSQVNVSQKNHSIKVLVIETDPIKRKGYLNPYMFAVAAHPLKPSELVHGLAVLCGMQSPDFEWPTQDLSSGKTDSSSYSAHKIKDGFKILAVEDHPTNQLVIGRQLQSLGYDYDMADDGVDGLEMWQQSNYSLILTDCHMPRMDGFELTRTIRRIESERSLPRIPIVAITANALVGEADTCFESGMDEYISKPVEIDQLHKKLLKWAADDSHKAVSTKVDAKVDAVEEHLPNEEQELLTTESLDIAHLMTVIGTDEKEIIDEILSMFWESVQDDFVGLKEALNKKESTAVRSRAHAAKGASASSGAIQLSEIFKWIEKNHSDFEGIDKRLVMIDEELKAIESKLAEMNII